MGKRVGGSAYSRIGVWASKTAFPHTGPVCPRSVSEGFSLCLRLCPLDSFVSLPLPHQSLCLIQSIAEVAYSRKKTPDSVFFISVIQATDSTATGWRAQSAEPSQALATVHPRLKPAD